MTSQALQRKNKLMSKRTVTIVTSVDGKTLQEVAPTLINKFDNFSHAMKEIMRATGRRVNELKTKTEGLAAYSVRS